MDDVILTHKPRQFNVAVKPIEAQPTCSPELSMGWVDPWVGLGWVGSGWVETFQFLVGWVGLGPLQQKY